MMETRQSQQLFFDPDQHPEDTLKAFEEFTQLFELRYDAQFPDPPKVSMDAAIDRWKVANTTEKNQNPRPDLAAYDAIRNDWRSKDKVAKFLGMFSSIRLYSDWCAIKPDDLERKTSKWDEFLVAMRLYYKPTENVTLKNFHFRALSQKQDETFPSFCSRVKREAKHCNLKCEHAECSAETTAIRDKIIIGPHNSTIREEALKKSWDLETLCCEGMKIESAARGGAEISGDVVHRIGKYSFSKMKSIRKQQQHVEPNFPEISCYSCGNRVNGSIIKHRNSNCPAKFSKCHNCGKTGHFSKVCKSPKKIHQVKREEDKEKQESESEVSQDETYSINLFRIKSPYANPRLGSGVTNKNDFKIQVIVNNSLDTVIADTGARVSVCGTKQAKKWDLLVKMVPSSAKIKPYKSAPISVYGKARCAVSFGETSMPVVWHIISGSCEPVLDGNTSVQLGIVEFKSKPSPLQLVLMIGSSHKLASKLQDCLSKYPENFTGLGELKNHNVKLHLNHNVKPVVVPPRSTPYHLQARAQKAIEEMIQLDVIEEHPADQLAPWVSNIALAPKSDCSLRITLDARCVNKALQSLNQPIPRHEDINSQLSGCKVFSKLDFESAFWQLELDEDSRYLTVFHLNDRLYRYKRLNMGLKPSQGELNAALRPVFAQIDNVYLIHDDLIIATSNDEDHIKATEQVMQAIFRAGLTLNPSKCSFGKKEISLWGMVYGADRIKPDPAKVEALDHITPPTSKEDRISFLCIMQSNADFIPNFAQKSAPLRHLTKGKVKFNWQDQHQQCFEELRHAFKKDSPLRYFNMGKITFIFTDAHVSGLGAMPCQSDSIDIVKPVAFVSRTANSAESRYPQLDLEAASVDFALRRFRNYVVGSPYQIMVVTDHKPLVQIFNNNRPGSIRTERIKIRHQDVRYE